MPGESGLALIRFAKENYPDTGRLMITGHGAPEISNEVIKVGVYGYIIKPVAKNELLITVENALAHLLLDRHMQASQRVLEKEISDQTEKASAIMNNLNVGVAMFDKHMAVVEFNRKLHQWFPEICPGKTIPCSTTGNCPNDNSQCTDCAMLSTFRTGSIGETEGQMMTAQGEKDFRVVTSPVFDKQGNVYAGVALYEDITEKKPPRKGPPAGAETRSGWPTGRWHRP